MPKTITQTVYKFSELSDDAKESAKDEYKESFGYVWNMEALESIKALAKHFGGKVKNYSIEWWNPNGSWMDFDMPESEEIVERFWNGEKSAYDMNDSELESAAKESIKTLAEKLGAYDPETGKGLGYCVLTGYCADENAIDGLRAGIKAGKSLDESMQMAFKSWMKSCNEDYESFYSDGEFSEHSDSNGYWYDEDGHLVK